MIGRIGTQDREREGERAVIVAVEDRCVHPTLDTLACGEASLVPYCPVWRQPSAPIMRLQHVTVVQYGHYSISQWSVG